MTTEEFKNLKTGDEIYVYSFTQNEIIKIKVLNVNYDSNIIKISTDFCSYFLGERHRLHFSYEKCKIQHIKLLMRNNIDVSDHKEFIEQNVEHFI
jgi:hypothetical protein